MKVLGLEVRRFASTGGPQAPPAGEFGRDSDAWVDAFMGGGPDVNPLLTGSLKFDVFDEMVLTDSTVKQLVWTPTLAIRSAKWETKPASSDGVDQLINDAVAWQFGLNGEDGHLSDSWPRWTDQSLLCMRYGAFLEEIIWGDVIEWVGADGQARLVRPIDRMAPRAPRTISEITWNHGRIEEIKQNLPDTKPIPGNKLAYYVIDPQPGRWDGTSTLRAAWGPWHLKKQLMISAGIAWDRWAAGIPVVRYPKSGGQAALDKAEELGRAVRSHEHAYAAFEGAAPDAQNPEGWDLDIKGGVGVLPDPVPMLRQYDLQIYGAGLLQWMALGHSTTGSRATAQVQDEAFYMALESIAGDLALERRRQVFRRFVDVNFGTEYDTPDLTVSKIQSEDVEKLGRVLYDLKNAGFDLSNAELQNYVLALAHLPETAVTQPQPSTEGTGLPAATVTPAQLRAAERRLQVAFDKTITTELGKQRQLELDSVASQPIVIPITVPTAAAADEPALAAMLERTLERLAEKSDQPIQLEVKIQGEPRARTATARKGDDGETIVEYVYDDDGKRT